MQMARLSVSSSLTERRGMVQNRRWDRELAAHKGLIEGGSDQGDTPMTVQPLARVCGGRCSRRKCELYY